MKKLPTVFFAFFMLINSASAFTLDTKEISVEEIKGRFDVILYGGRHGNDLETIAYLDPLYDEYQIQIFAPDFDYRIVHSKDDKTAIDVAQKFTGWHSSFMRFIYSKIITPDGKIVGYEVKPLYLPFVFGRSDVFDISYRLKDKKVIITIKLLHKIERQLYYLDNNQSRP
ncbi:MAG: hypothetical protein SNJ53_01330 [Thermodesulfovibrionales bacterium]